MKSRIAFVGVFSSVLAVCACCPAEDFLLADGQAWPGRILVSRNGTVETFHVRPTPLPDDLVPRVQSIALLEQGRTAFTSGLDRTVLEATSRGESTLHHGGYLARQVRKGEDGTLYWSGLETPQYGNPLPDGFIYALDPDTNVMRTLLTFSQGDVGHDWWGSFDVHQGRFYVGTLQDRTRLFDISASPVKHVATLPFSATAFRFAADGSLYAANGQGQLHRVADLARPEDYSTVLDLSTPFVDFEFLPQP